MMQMADWNQDQRTRSVAEEEDRRRKRRVNKRPEEQKHNHLGEDRPENHSRCCRERVGGGTRKNTRKGE